MSTEQEKESEAAIQLYNATEFLLKEYDDVREQIAHQGIRIPESTAQESTERAMSFFRTVYHIPTPKPGPKT